MNDVILLVDKPAGMSSFGVVARVRRILSEKAGFVELKGKDGVVRQKRKKVKVGHTGTLDPFATGLLILLTGKETRRSNEFLKLDKEYITTIKLGEVSSTGDVEGEIETYGAVDGRFALEEPSAGQRPEDEEASARNDGTEELRVPQEQSDWIPARKNLIIPTLSQVEEVVASFVGEIEQTVPSFSAVKINGQRAYKLAREGKTVEMPRRKVKIYELEILRYEWPELELRCKVSSGTYIRALGEDIGKELGVGGYLTQLRRTQVGEYRVEDAKTLDEIMRDNVLK